MNDFEREILEECAGQRKPRAWGAAVGAAISFLKNKGYLDRTGKITDAGRSELTRQQREGV